jgi:sugar-specific transcriptional regulator TrmB
MPRQRIYDVLATLVEKGLASHRPGPPAKYAAVSPEFALERLLARRRDELERLEASSREVIEALAPAFAEGQKERSPLDYIEVLRDRDAINERFGMEDPVAGASELTIMVIEHPELARLLKIAFDAVWREGLTFEQVADRVPGSDPVGV